MKLTKTSDLKQLGKEARKNAIGLYKSDNWRIRMLASILNAALTQKKTTFLWSKSICDELLKHDSRASRKSMNDDFKKLNAWLYQSFIIELRPASTFEAKDKLGAIVEIVHKESLELIYKAAGEDFLRDQKTATIEFYDQYVKNIEAKVPVRGPREGSPVDGDGDVIETVYANVSVSGAASAEPEGSQKAGRAETNASGHPHPHAHPSTTLVNDEKTHFDDTSNYSEPLAPKNRFQMTQDQIKHYSIEQKLQFLVGSEDFTQAKHRSKFYDFLDLVRKGKILSPKQLKMVDDQSVKVLRKIIDKKNN
jgi:hypothetical protein